MSVGRRAQTEVGGYLRSVHGRKQFVSKGFVNIFEERIGCNVSHWDKTRDVDEEHGANG